MVVYAMQPYFFPYLGYFTGIRLSDVFVVVDTVQFRKKSWMHRNRILNLEKDFTYINIPSQRHIERSTLIKDVEISDNVDWKTILLQQLGIYKKRAPYYYRVTELIRSCIEYQTRMLSEWNVNSILKICEYLEIKCNVIILSDSSLSLAPINEADEWGLSITMAVGADKYINLPGGMEFYNREKYRNKNIDLKFIKNNISPYNQTVSQFVPSLSILDVMMFNSVKDTNALIDDFIYL